MTDQSPSPRRPAGTDSILVTGASGTMGQAVVRALAATGETVIAGMRDPRAWSAADAMRASDTGADASWGRPATGRPGQADPTGQADRGASVRPGGKPPRAPNQKPARNPGGKPGGKPAGSPTGKPTGLPAATIGARSGPVPAGGPASADGGALLRAFDLADRGTWERALAGVDRVFLQIPPMISDVSRTLIPFIDTALEQGTVRQIVFLSAPGVRFGPRSPHRVVEHYLTRTRAPHTILRPNVLMQSLTTVCRDDIRLRSDLQLPAGGGRAAFVDADDVGRVAARVLTETGHLQKTYVLAGEQSFGYTRVAAILTEVLGRPVRYTATSEADFAALAAAQGLAAPEIAAQAAWYRAVRRHLSALPNRSIRRLTGQPATTLPAFVERHRQTWL